MREIKFRIYVKKEQKMIYGKQAMAVKSLTPNYAYLDSEVELMQYTGLKDRNGKEIYEGDMVELQCETTEGFYRKDRFEVIWDEENAQFALKRMNTIYLDLNMDLHESVIIGNVFETPDWDC